MPIADHLLPLQRALQILSQQGAHGFVLLRDLSPFESIHFQNQEDFIRHLRTDRHLSEYFHCRCGKKFSRPYLFQQHVEQGECQGNRSYTCMCGHTVQNYSDALVLVSTHFNKCDEPQPIGRPSKKPMAPGDPEASS